jgi:hypothetical protein
MITDDLQLCRKDQNGHIISSRDCKESAESGAMSLLALLI